MDDPWIMDIEPKKLRQIQLMLDDEKTRNTFVDTLPPHIYNWEVEQDMETQGSWVGMTRGKWLLRYLDSKAGRVSDLIYWFEEANIEKALLLLKEDEPLQIVQQPLPTVKVHQGAELCISCEASSFPRPEYQWFKGEEELLFQQESVLLIPSARKEDAGIYVCYAYKKNIATNDYSSLSFDPVEVTVLPRALPTFPDFGKKVQETNPSAFFLPGCQKLVSCQNEPPRENIVAKSSPNREKIIIKKHPYSPGKVAQGTKLWFNCFASAHHPVKYQWHQNGEEMAGEESDKLLISELYPDRETGCMKFEYFCKVYNEYGQICSRTAFVELEKANDQTTYVAEDKLALLIANDKYDAYEECLVTPAIDVVDLSKLLKSIDFKVVPLRNLSLEELKKAFQAFCKLLKPESYVIFFFAGHGFECFGQTYLQPVDCSANFQPEESMCAEYILQQLQDTKPALILLLIDACRKRPPRICEELGEIYEAPMKNNTVYGYATSFLSSAYESDERNSFFVKHLKNYITHDKSIQEVFLQVQGDFSTEQLTKKMQHPVIESSLSVPRKLRDELRNPPDIFMYPFPSWAYHEREIIQKRSQTNDQLRFCFIVEVKDHMDVYFNGVDIYLFMELREDAILRILHAIELNMELNSPKLQVHPVEGVRLRDKVLILGQRNLVLKKEVLGMQNIQGNELNVKILLKFDFNRTKETELKLSLTIEKMKSIKVFW